MKLQLVFFAFPIFTVAALSGCSPHNNGDHIHAKGVSEIESLTHIEIPYDNHEDEFIKAVYRSSNSTDTDQPPLRVIIIPGTPSDVGFWGEAIYRIDARAEVFAIERPGYNGSGPKHAVTNLTEQADAIGALVKDHDGNVIVVGQSYGASVALTAMKKYSGAIDRAYLVSPYVFPVSGRKLFWLNIIRYTPLRYIGGAITNHSIAEIATHRRQSSDVIEVAENSCAQVHIFHGQQDDLVDAEDARALQSLFPSCANATVEIVEDGDHYLQVHSLQPLLKSLNAFIQKKRSPNLQN